MIIAIIVAAAALAVVELQPFPKAWINRLVASSIAWAALMLARHLV